ncbi:NADAR domain-containing protein [Mastigocoleus sp. MO_188.B34]|uniref:NADAR family protein n=1 Tax=Mastigocoleus sp. MO_188.B34 TaxID=3036635 RepID=UPI002639F2A7|nr:NADAR domain-containing protein [Mastigocoleus sp. MO_188.B34]MDJ0694649.1 NADAR domain-containing protein [Mastigocoleus sp. MO_188.B34]
MTIYFYKVWQPYGCFSNFSKHGIFIQGAYWSTVEHYYQAQKFVDTEYEAVIPIIHKVSTPEEAASLGRCSTRKPHPEWDIRKIEVMRKAVLTKFITHADIRDILLGTGDRLLVEDSARDYFWGCGADRSGQNHLGKILMSVREEIRNLLPLSTAVRNISHKT